MQYHGHVARGSGTRAPVLVTKRGAPPHLLPVLLGVVVVSVMEGEAELLSQCHAHAGLATTCIIIMYISIFTFPKRTSMRRKRIN